MGRVERFVREERCERKRVRLKKLMETEIAVEKMRERGRMKKRERNRELKKERVRERNREYEKEENGRSERWKNIKKGSKQEREQERKTKSLVQKVEKQNN